MSTTRRYPTDFDPKEVTRPEFDEYKSSLDPIRYLTHGQFEQEGFDTQYHYGEQRFWVARRSSANSGPTQTRLRFTRLG